MTDDIGAELLKKVRQSFASELGDSSKRLAQLLKKIESGKGSFDDVSRFAHECGSALSRAIAANVTSESLPNGQLYYNIAEKILKPMLHDNYTLINLAAQAAQEAADKRLGVTLKPQQAQFPEDRAHSIIQAAADAQDEQKRSRILDAPVRNITDSFYTDYIEQNADFRVKAGMGAVVVRSTNGKCCDWCASLAGTYQYPDVPKDIWCFHDNCTCTLLYSSAKTTSVHGRRFDYRLTDEQKRKALANAPKVTRISREQGQRIQERLLAGVDFSGGSGIIRAGTISGALNPDSEEAQAHAERYYESVRHMTTDVKRIAQNTGFSEELIEHIKKFIFLDEHELDGEIRRFDPSFEMAQSWQRLIDGKNILPHDMTLLYHEEMERDLMLQGYDQDEAHRITSEKHNYSKEANVYYGKIERDRKKR